ncbi:hypothetical protein ACT3XG_03670 [Paenibacillus polymyxa]|nr:hypothetical protein [Paenibacillus polymyxa]
MKVLGIGDNVVDKYVHLRMMYPGGNLILVCLPKKREWMQPL